MHALKSFAARLAQGVSWQVELLALCLLVGIACSGCYQPTVVPPTASIAPPIRTAPGPVIVHPTEPVQPPTIPPIVQPTEPPAAANRWKPDAEVRDWNYIVLHHTASTTGNVETIHEEHLKRKDKKGNHWLGIGYHFVIGNGSGMNDGDVEPTFRWRQQLQGAHAGVADYNQRGIGIVLIGNFENSPPTTAQTRAVKELVDTLKREYHIPMNRVIGHNDVKATECPGKLFPMSDIRGGLTVGNEQAAIQSTPHELTSINLLGDSRK